MLRLFLLYLIAFALGLFCFTATKLIVMVFVAIFYGGGFGWDAGDTKFLIVNGMLMGVLFSALATVAWKRNR
ncbi:hypothetical protein [Paraburkholderia phenoliruptrix]|uniref:hypothetical protein n=1 Tax=Paraburkholderia phenoliruptrix TaxID=252970 RepID=UPI002869B622|nr:hypothetical protein [Paraburkholderia phenoliruptrix]WMY09820.1 hypothetical protein P3F88_08715 [Paraburkholderia phenoliruptrix]